MGCWFVHSDAVCALYTRDYYLKVYRFTFLFVSFVDVRDIDEERRNTVIRNIKTSASDIAARRGVRLDLEILNQDPPAESSEWVIKSIDSASEQLGLKFKHMKSRAYHDSLFMARFVL